MARERVIALVDMDCFYVQVEQRLNPSLYGKPCAVVQYNTWKGGGIIAVGYEARALGVTRRMRGDEAKEKCPDIILARVPEARGKADLTRYREAGAEVIEVLQTFCDVCERASVDEAYLDLTEQVERSLENMTLEKLAEQTLECSHIIGFTNKDSSECTVESHQLKGQWLAGLSDKHNRCLAIGSLIVQKAREAVKEKTGFTCSAGIAHNKVMAKIAGGSHKPDQQTVIPHQSVATFFETIPIGKVRFFGGKFGQSVMNLLQVEKMSEITKFTEQQLRNWFGVKSGSWLYHVCRGVENETVCSRHLTKSTGCGKNFPGKMKLVSKEKVCHWMLQLAEELNDRLKGEENKNHRRATLVSVGLTTANNTSSVRSFPLKCTHPQTLCDKAMQVIKTFNSGTGDVWHPGIVCLNMNASKFEDISKHQGSSSIASFFGKKEPDTKSLLELNEKDTLTNPQSCPQTTEKNTTNIDEAIEDDREDTTQSTVISCAVSTSKNNDHAFNYDRDEIDPLIVDELPEDIRNEMLTFLSNQKTSGKKKRCLNGIEKYTLQEANTPSKIKTPFTRFTVTDGSKTPLTTTAANKTPFTDAYDNKISLRGISDEDVESNFESPGKVQCCRCNEKLCQTEMSEHLDFHFALDLQNNDQVNESLRIISPPKKRQRSTIDSFFVAKEK